MLTQEITPDTPVVLLTVGQLCDYLKSHVDWLSNMQPESKEDTTVQPVRYVYGIRGIMRLFGVSNVTAQRYKRTIIKDAVKQNGRVIVTDAEMAIKLFEKYRGYEDGYLSRLHQDIKSNT